MRGGGGAGGTRGRQMRSKEVVMGTLALWREAERQQGQAGEGPRGGAHGRGA